MSQPEIQFHYINLVAIRLAACRARVLEMVSTDQSVELNRRKLGVNAADEA